MSFPYCLGISAWMEIFAETYYKHWCGCMPFNTETVSFMLASLRPQYASNKPGCTRCCPTMVKGKHGYTQRRSKKPVIIASSGSIPLFPRCPRILSVVCLKGGVSDSGERLLIFDLNNQINRPLDPPPNSWIAKTTTMQFF